MEARISERCKVPKCYKRLYQKSWAMKGIQLLWVIVIYVGCYAARDANETPIQTDANDERKPNEQPSASSTVPTIENDTVSNGDNHLAIEIKSQSTQLCKGECIDIAVEASGGITPYTFAWDHGLAPTSGPHRVCPEVTTVYAVSVSDTGLNTEEFVIPAEAVRATIELLIRDDCASPGENGDRDAGMCSDGGCEPIDACEIDNGGCDPLVDCSSTNGVRACGPCPPDYRGDGYTGCIPIWIQQLAAPGDETANGVATDDRGNVYITGYTNSDLDGNTNAGGYDMFLVKYDGEGKKQWTRLLGTSGFENGHDVATDSSGSVYVTGMTEGNLDGNTNAGYYDMFLVKYDSEGNKQWTRQLGTSSNDDGNGVATDNDGNVYVTGTTHGQLGENGIASNDDIYIVKYDSAGDRQWTRQLGSSENDWGSNVATDSVGNVYLTGVISGDLAGNISAGKDDSVIAKYSDEGDLLWNRQFGMSGYSYVWGGIATDSSGNIYVAGDTDTSGEDDGSDYDPLVVKYNSEGDQQWTRIYGTSGLGGIHGIAIDSTDNVYVTGGTEGIMEGNVDESNRDLYIIKYNSEGVEQWMRQRSTAQSDYGADIAIDGSDTIYVVGVYSDGLNEIEGWCMCDVFVIKYDSDGNPL